MCGGGGRPRHRRRDVVQGPRVVEWTMDEDEGRGRPLELFWDGLDPADPDEEPEAITLKEVVADIRQRMWERGWRPVEIYDHDRSVGFNGHSVNSPGMRPQQARSEP
jgi:hypothetical protein